MDPLSVAASVITLIVCCADVGNYLAEVKNGPKSAERLRAQVLELQQALTRLDEFLRGESAGGNKFAKTCALIKSTELCERHLLKVRKKLEKVNKSLFQWMTFPMDEKEISQSLEVLRGCAQTFHFFLSIDGW
jgi:hypothetical protein